MFCHANSPRFSFLHIQCNNYAFINFLQQSIISLWQSSIFSTDMMEKNFCARTSLLRRSFRFSVSRLSDESMVASRSHNNRMITTALSNKKPILCSKEEQQNGKNKADARDDDQTSTKKKKKK